MAQPYTPTEQRMLAVLRDGLPHARLELKACLYDDMGELSNIRAHLTALRKKLRPIGQDVACEMCNGNTSYRLVRLLANANDGKR